MKYTAETCMEYMALHDVDCDADIYDYVAVIDCDSVTTSPSSIYTQDGDIRPMTNAEIIFFLFFFFFL